MVIFVFAVWPGEAYEIDFHKESSKRDSSKNAHVPVPDRGILKSSRALPEPIWSQFSYFLWDRIYRQVSYADFLSFCRFSCLHSFSLFFPASFYLYIFPQTAGAEWGSDGLVRGSGASMGSAAPRLTQLLLAGIANGDLCSRLV